MSSPPRSAPLPPGTRPIAAALGASETLSDLGRRMRESQGRLDALRGMLPAALHAALRAGPLDGEGWTLLAPNQAVAVKLRQLLPALQAQLRHHGWAEPPVRIKVLGR